MFFRVAVLLLAAVFLWSVVRSPDAGNAAGLLVRNTPQLGWAIPFLPPGPAIVRSTVPTPGDPAERGTLYFPAAGGPWPGVVVLPGLVPLGREDPQVVTLSRSLADLGLAVYVPDLPGLKDGRMTGAALTACALDVRWFAGSRYVQGPGVALLGVCVGASLAILTAAEGSPPVRAVIALDPYASMRDLVQAATTGEAPGPGGALEPFTMDPWAVAALARGAAYTVADPASRATLLQAIGGETSADPLAPLRDAAWPAHLSPAAAAWWRLLANRSPKAFDGLYQALPSGVRDELDALSPVRRVAAVRVPVLVLDPAVDTAYPPTEGRWLARGNPGRVELTVSPLVDHVTPDLEGADWQDLGRLWGFACRTVDILREP